MSDLDLTDPYDPDPFESGPRTLPATPGLRLVRPDAAQLPPADEPADERADEPAEQPASEPVQEPTGETPGTGRVPWKAAASSVPRLRQQPVALEPAAEPEAFPGFAQDALPGRAGVSFAGRHALRDDVDGDEGAADAAPPLAIEPPFWEVWLERARALPAPVLIGAGVVLLTVLVAAVAVRPRGEGGVSLAAIRQNPEAYDGRQVAVRGKAGETFSVGGNWVYTLREGRDTIVVYSRNRKPALNENVSTAGTVSIGYLDGMPRVALFEDAAAPTP